MADSGRRATLPELGLIPLNRRPRGRWFRLAHPALSYPVEVLLDITADGRLVCRRLVAGDQEAGSEISARSLRLIPLAQALAKSGRPWTRTEGGRLAQRPLYRAGLIANPLNAPGGRSSAPRLRPGPKGWPVEHFRLVAERYEDARQREPRRPLQTFADEWPTSLATARRWIRHAEKLKKDGGL